jgi:pyruvate dehydrogenase E1 component
MSTDTDRKVELAPSATHGTARSAGGLSVGATSGIANGGSNGSRSNGSSPNGSSPDGSAASNGKATAIGVSPAIATQPMDDEQRAESQEWLESLAWVLKNEGPQRVAQLLEQLEDYAYLKGVRIPFTANTPYINTIPLSQQPRYPGNLNIEQRIRSIIRWNAMAMVTRANKESAGIGGHISTYASSATLYEVGFNHFFKGKDHPDGPDQVYFQGHGSPGQYARAFVEGRLDEQNLKNFRQELRDYPGLSSYPHPWLMPEFWEFPTVSMGLGPICSIYQARFNRYITARGLKDVSKSRVWCFIGDGETDEPETLGAITLASREKLDNLTWVINCNLQRLDGPVRGNGKIIQELEAIFRGAGWNVIKVLWGGEWDALLEKDTTGELIERMNEVVDGQYQKYSVSPGDYVRQHFFGKSPTLLKLVEHMTDEQIQRIKRGGHDAEKVYAAFKAATEHKGQPTVILAKTIKGYGLGEAGEGKNITHGQKKLNEDEMRDFRTRFNIPISDDEVAKAPFYRPPEDSEEMKYLQARRKEMGGSLPERRVCAPPIEMPEEKVFTEFFDSSGERTPATTQVMVKLFQNLMRDKKVGEMIVPIVPDEARTFGMEGLISSFGIYSSLGQLYEPVDKAGLMYYKEAKNGQILEEGITEAGSMASFVAAGTAYATHGLNTIPFFIYYSMFGPQRMGDLFWLAGDIRARGFVIGATAGRTTLAGEGLQHQDGNSHLLVYPIPNCVAYDPAYAFEIAVIIRDGIRRMYVEQESIFYYLTVGNEQYSQPAMPAGSEAGILKGLYKFKPAAKPGAKLRAQLFGSGAILNEVVEAQQILAEKYNVHADVWSATSYKNLYMDALDVEHHNLLHPEAPRVPYVTECLQGAPGPVVAASDYVKTLPKSIEKWIPGGVTSLGTDGFGRSDNRGALRDFFAVDAKHVVLATLDALAADKKVPASVVQKAIKEMGINTDAPNSTRV